MRITDPVIPRGATVVVIGANGYMAVEVCEKLLDAGYRVRGTVRDVSKHQARLHGLFDKRYPHQFSLVQVPDFEAENAFDEAFKGASGVIFVSVPTIFDPEPKNVVDPVVKGLLNTLEAARNAGVLRYVLNSSSKAVDSADYSKPSRELTVDTFNTGAIDEMNSGENDGSFQRIVAVYSGARAAAEMKFWEWVKQNKESLPFVANCVVPDGQFGRALDMYSVEHGISSNGQLKAALQGDWGKVPLQLAFISDVQDSARLMVAAVASRSITNERVFSYSISRSWNDMRHAVRKMFPDRPELVTGEDQAVRGRDLATADEPIKRAEEILRGVGQPGFASEEAILKDFVSSMFP